MKLLLLLLLPVNLPHHFVVGHTGETPMSRRIRNAILEGLRAGLHVDCGLPGFYF